MKTTLSIILISFLLFSNLFAQEAATGSCGTKSWSPEEVEKLPFFKNSQWLIEEGRKKVFPSP